MHISNSLWMLWNLHIWQLLPLILFFSCFLNYFTGSNTTKFFLLVPWEIWLLIEWIRGVKASRGYLAELGALALVYMHFVFLIRISVKLTWFKLRSLSSFRNHLVFILVFFIGFWKIYSYTTAWNTTLSFFTVVWLFVYLLLRNRKMILLLNLTRF